MKMFLLAAVAACAIAAPASADNYVQTATVTSSAPKVATVNFDKFDSTLGTLNSVTLMFSSVLDASGTLTNNSIVLPRNYLLSTGAIAGLTGNGFNFMQGLGIGLDLVHVPRHNSVGLSYDATNSDSETLTSNLSAFVGSDPLAFTFVSTSLFGMLGINGTLDMDTQIGGWAKITYDYTPNAAGAVPEPASWAMMMLGIGAVGGAMRRRRSAVTTTVRYA
ncbi:choice-of-anchor E domain-containing protein [Sphingomonas sp. JC676]|uniref:choice-of-anchor E domain-containing protein n=1 Tax=Sphingomonas sp. JC676 TaxID=2768065 RepID=UPI00223AD8A9|nr:choice-of-anchor E domain-containing protein [Sphingomonas sp. JC676]